MATLKDVARETGLTVSTVSRVLNNRGYISAAARQNVYEAMERLNYQPNALARSLSKQTSSMIGVIVPHIRHPYFAELISNLENQAYKNGYQILVFNSQEKDEKEWDCLRMCFSNRVAGIILCSGSVKVADLQGLNVPLITIERFLEEGSAMVGCDNIQGGRLAAKHLINRGCKHLIHISGVYGTAMPADDRSVGFEEICRQHGVDYQIISTDAMQYESLHYQENLEHLLCDNPQIDGIFASSDLIAAQLLQVCRKLNIPVPGQLKIIGFDDVNIASLVAPPITTIHQPMKEMSRMAIELLKSVQNEEAIPSRTILPVSLVVREST